MEPTTMKHFLDNFFVGCALVLATLGVGVTGRLGTSGAAPAAARAPASPPPPSPPAARVEPRRYSRFHANDSYFGKPIPCTSEEKTCLRYNALYSPQSKRCVYGYDADKNEFLNGSGHLFASDYIDPCPGYRMTYDGRCYRKQTVRDVICGCDVEPTKHFLGGVECRCSPATPIHVEQPPEEGRCLIPRLRINNSVFHTPIDAIQGFTNELIDIRKFDPPPRFNCSVEQRGCFANRKVWLPEAKSCFALLERGPCPADHVVTLDIEAAKKGYLTSLCAHTRGGCPPGQKRMAFDGQCHSDDNLNLVTMVTLNQFGFYVPIDNDVSLSIVPDTVSSMTSSCFLSVITWAVQSAPFVPMPPCPSSNDGKCNYELLFESSLPEDD